LPCLDHLRDLWPGNAEIQITWADIAISAGAASPAVLDAITVAEQAGAHPYWAGYHRLRALGALDRRTDLVAQTAALTAAGGDLDPLLRLVREWRESGKAEVAFALLEGLRQSRPDHGPAAQAWADLAISKGLHGTAVATALDCALAGGHDPYWTRYHRLRLWLAQGQSWLALDECRAIRALGGSPDPFLYVIAQTRGLDNEARRALEQAVQAAEPVADAPSLALNGS